MHEPIVVELPTKGLEVPGVEILGQDRLGKGIGRVQHQQAPAPFYNPRGLFRLQHIVQPANKLVEANTGGTRKGS